MHNEAPSAVSHAAEPKAYQPGAELHFKATPALIAKIAELLRKFFGRQRDAVLPKIAAGDDDWWDDERWKRELANDLKLLSVSAVQQQATETIVDKGLAPWADNAKRAEAILPAGAEARGGWE